MDYNRMRQAAHNINKGRRDATSSGLEMLLKPQRLAPSAWCTFVLYVLSLMLLASTPIQAAERWQTTKFKVFSGNPFVGSKEVEQSPGFDWAEFEDQIGAPSAAEIAEIERALEEAAVWYKDRGFPPPWVEPIIETPDGPAYQVYVCSEEWDSAITETVSNVLKNMAGWELRWGTCPNDKAGSYATPCGKDPTRQRYLVINSKASLDAGGKLTELGYQTIAHELMHAIIARTPFGRADQSCEVGFWITESLPDAISFDLAEELWEKKRYTPPMTTPAIIKRYGFRPYSEKLTEGGTIVPPGGGLLELKYFTSSFWRYIADAYPQGWRVLVTNGSGAAPGLLDLKLSSGKGWRREVDWLDEGLRGKFNLGLNSMYNLFVGHFAYRMAPFERYRGKPPEQSLEHWVGRVFGDCQKVDLAAASSQTVFLYLEQLTSKCIWVEPAGSGLVQVSFQAESDDLSLLQDIAIGRAGTALNATGRIAPHPTAPGMHIASWRDFPQDGSRSNVYVVSNIARVPSRTLPRTVEVTVSKPVNTNSEWVGPLPPARVAQPPQKPGFDRHAKKLAQQKRDTAAMVAEQMNLDKESLNPNVSSGVQVQREVKRPPCAEPFKYDACGPALVISLDLMPGTYIGPGQTNAQGGIAAQTFGALQAMAQTSVLDTEAVMKRLQARLDKIDGSGVNIAIPLVDYGFTGSFDNAEISVRMAGGKLLRAFGPPDSRQRTRLTGQVTIEEYTPQLMRGRFVAPLAEFEPGAGDGQPPTYHRRQTVKGTFTSVAPWMNDERTSLLPESTEDMADDIANTLGVPADMVYKMKQNGGLTGGARPPIPGGSGTSVGAGLSSDCSCECDMRESADELCELFCEEEFAICDSR